MPPRLFDGVNDVIEFSLGALNFTSPTTTAALIRKTRADSSGTFMTIFYVAPAAGTPGVGLGINAADNQLAYIRDNSNTRSASVTVLTADGWCLVACVKAAATGPKLFKYVYNTDTWTSATAATTTDATTPGGTAIPTIGAYASQANDYEGDCGLVGHWNRALSDAEVFSLAHSLTSWRELNPKGLWLLNQSVTTMSVPDESGNGSNQSALTGTSISTVAVPFSYGGPIHEVGAGSAVEKVSVMPWELMGASASNLLGNVPTTAAVPRVWQDTSAPTVSDDSSTGVGVGDIWVEGTTLAVYWCTSAAVGAAVWKRVTA